LLNYNYCAKTRKKNR